MITSAAASKIYRSSGLESQQNIDIKLEAGANLEWLPQETIVFDGAIYRQNLRVELAPTARILLWEITRFGRSARGEKFASGEWRSHTEVWQQNSPLWIDRQLLKRWRKNARKSSRTRRKTRSRYPRLGRRTRHHRVRGKSAIFAM